MHWNVPLDGLSGSATLVRVLDCWLNDCEEIANCKTNTESTSHFIKLLKSTSIIGRKPLLPSQKAPTCIIDYRVYTCTNSHNNIYVLNLMSTKLRHILQDFRYINNV